jgi:hypothetical protein
MRFWYSHQGYGPATWHGEELGFDPEKSTFR